MFLNGCRQGVGDVAGEDGADDGDSEGTADSRAALLSPESMPARAGGSEVMMPVERVGMLSPMPVETPTARFCRIPAALAQDPPVPAAKAFYVNLPVSLTYDGGPGSAERTASGVDPVLDGLSLCCGSITVPR